MNASSRRSWLVALLTVAMCAACASPATVVAARELASDAPCVLDDAAPDFPLQATGCVAMIDGVGVSPNGFNTWARLNIILQPTDREGWAQMKLEYVEIYINEVLIDREVAAVGFTLEGRERDLWFAVLFGEGESLDERLEIATGSGERSEDEVLAMWRGHATRRAYACHVAGCAQRDGWDPASSYGVRYDAYEDLTLAVMARHDVILMPENVVVRWG